MYIKDKLLNSHTISPLVQKNRFRTSLIECKIEKQKNINCRDNKKHVKETYEKKKITSIFFVCLFFKSNKIDLYFIFSFLFVCFCLLFGNTAFSKTWSPKNKNFKYCFNIIEGTNLNSLIKLSKFLKELPKTI